MTILNISSKATGPVVTKLHVEPPGDEERILFKPFMSLNQHGCLADVWQNFKNLLGNQ